MAAVLDRHQRDALWHDVAEWVLNADFGDVTGALKAGEGADARRLAWKFRAAMRLLDDLGWDRLDPREAYALTMPDLDLLRYLADEAEGWLRDQRGALDRAEFPPMSDAEWARYLAEARAERDHNLDVVGACRTLLRAD